MYNLQFSLQAASPETFGYTLVSFQTLRKVSANVLKGVRACIQEQGHFQYLL
jgi:hypothetical protein